MQFCLWIERLVFFSQTTTSCEQLNSTDAVVAGKHRLEVQALQLQQPNSMMADNNIEVEVQVEEKKRKNSSSDLKKVVKSAGINVIKKGIKMGGFQQKLHKQTNSAAAVASSSPEMFDYSKGEASALGFEPLAAQAEKPEINVMKLCDYSQVMNRTTEAAEQQLVNSEAIDNALIPPPTTKEDSSASSQQPQPPAKRVVTFSSKVRWKTSQNSLRKASPVSRPTNPIWDTFTKFFPKRSH